MHAILRCSESCDCNKDEYDKTKCLVVMLKPLLWEYGTKSPAGVSAALEVSQRAAQWSHLLSKSPADLRRGLKSSTIWLFYKSNLVASWMHLHKCRCFHEHLRLLLESLRAHCSAPRGVWEHQKGPRSTGEVARSLWEGCVCLPDRFTFCWCCWASSDNRSWTKSNDASVTNTSPCPWSASSGSPCSVMCKYSFWASSSLLWYPRTHSGISLGSGHRGFSTRLLLGASAFLVKVNLLLAADIF